MGERALDRKILKALRNQEEEIFHGRIPGSLKEIDRARRVMPNGVPMAWMTGLYRHPPIVVEGGDGAWFSDIDGNRYLDMNQADLSATCGYGHPAIASAVSGQISKGAQFLLPGRDARAVAEEMAARTRVPAWQFTLSASSANTEAIRLSRLATGRNGIVMFDGGYHGHIDETFVTAASDESDGHAVLGLGLPDGVARATRIAPFNDLKAVEAILAGGDCACVLTEPVLTNCGLVMPTDNFLANLTSLCRDYGVLLILDETHSQTFAFGGLTRAWQLAPDILTLGKSLGGGVALGAYGITEKLSDLMVRHQDVDIGDSPGLATGGTMYGNALSLAAARAALNNIMTENGYRHVDRLGAQLATGLQAAVARQELDWHIDRLGGRISIWPVSDPPDDGAKAWAALDFELIDTRRIFMANRGIWDAIATAGPAVSFAHSSEDVTAYVTAFEEFLSALSGR